MVANAVPPDGPALAGVSTANTKAIGYAPASRLSDGLSQIVLAHRHVSAGDRVVVRTAQEARGKESGVAVTAVFWFVFALRDGRVVRIDIHAEEAAALEAAGLRE